MTKQEQQNKETVNITPTYYASDEVLLRASPTFRLLWEAQIDVLNMLDSTKCSKKQKDILNKIWFKLTEIYEWEKSLFVERSFEYFLPDKEELSYGYNKVTNLKQ